MEATQGADGHMAVVDFHPFPSNSIFWADLVDWIVFALPVLHSEDLVLPVGLDLSCPSSLDEISKKDTITWLEVLAKHFLVIVGFSMGCSFICIFGSNLVRLLHFLFPLSHIVLVTSVSIVSFNVKEKVNWQAR